MLLHFLRTKFQNVRNHLLWVLVTRQVINLLIDLGIAQDVAVDISSGNVGVAEQFAALLCKLEHALAAEIVDLDRVEKRLVKTDAGR